MQTGKLPEDGLHGHRLTRSDMLSKLLFHLFFFYFFGCYYSLFGTAVHPVDRNARAWQRR